MEALAMAPTQAFKEVGCHAIPFFPVMPGHPEITGKQAGRQAYRQAESLQIRPADLIVYDIAGTPQ
jgi:hypothetical protein